MANPTDMVLHFRKKGWSSGWVEKCWWIKDATKLGKFMSETGNHLINICKF